MADLTPHNLRSLACASLLLAVYGTTLVYRGWRRVRAHGCRSACSGFGQRCLSTGRRAISALRCRPRRGRADGEEDDPVARCVSRQVEERIVGDLRYLLSYAVPLLAVNLLIIVLNIVGGRQRSNTEGDDVLSFAAFAVFLAFKLCPGAVNARTASLFYVVVMSFVTLMLWPPQTPGALLYRSAGNWVWRHLSSVAFRKPIVASCCQLVYFLFATLRFSQVSAGAESDITASQGFIFEVCVLIVIVAFTCQAANSTRDKIRQDVTSTVLTDERSAMSAMLDLLCDVVVELGPDLHLQKGTSKLAALMMLDERHSPVAGAALQDFMPVGDDRQSFERCLAGVADAEGAPSAAYHGVLHVKLRDSLGNHLRVQLFYVRFRYLDNHGFLVGMREDADMLAQPIPELLSLSPEDGPESRKRRHKNPNATVGRGTPPSMLGKALGSPEEDEAQSTHSSSGSSCGRATGTPTSRMGRYLTLIWAMQRWLVERVEEEGRSCCAWHAAVATAQDTIVNMKEFECCPGFGPEKTCDCQCKKCGNLVASGDHRRNQQAGANTNLVCPHCSSRRMRSIVRPEAAAAAASGRGGGRDEPPQATRSAARMAL